MSEALNTPGAPIQQQPSNVASMDKSGVGDFASTHEQPATGEKKFSTGIFDCGAPDFLFACCWCGPLFPLSVSSADTSLVLTKLLRCARQEPPAL